MCVSMYICGALSLIALYEIDAFAWKIVLFGLGFLFMVAGCSKEDDLLRRVKELEDHES